MLPLSLAFIIVTFYSYCIRKSVSDTKPPPQQLGKRYAIGYGIIGYGIIDGIISYKIISYGIIGFGIIGYSVIDYSEFLGASYYCYNRKNSQAIGRKEQYDERNVKHIHKINTDI